MKEREIIRLKNISKLKLKNKHHNMQQLKIKIKNQSQKTEKKRTAIIKVYKNLASQFGWSSENTYTFQMSATQILNQE